MTDPFVDHYLLTDPFVDEPTQSSHYLFQPPTVMFWPYILSLDVCAPFALFSTFEASQGTLGVLVISVKILFGKFQFKRQSDFSDLVFYCTQPKDSLSLEQYDQSCSSSSHTLKTHSGGKSN